MLSALQISLVSGLIGQVLATPWDIEKRGCGNNCARAVIASANPERPNSADCSSFLGTTTTLPTVTVYQTVTGTITNQFTVSNTVVNTQTNIETITNTQTNTVQVTNTQTDQAEVTNTQTNQATETVTNTINTITTLPFLQARQAGPTIPAYASACKGVSASYSEACGCIGVSAYTVTLPAPTTIIDVPATQTDITTVQETQTDSATVVETATASATVEETNVNLETVVETNTASATVIETQTATATQTIVATVTAGPPQCVVQFPAACQQIAGKTGLALVGAIAACALQINSIQGTIGDQIRAAAATCNRAGNAAAVVRCYRAAFQC